MQKKPTPQLGILGGMSTVATAEYYQLINQGVREYHGGFATAEMLVSSVDFGKIERFVRSGRWQEAGDYLAQKAQNLERAGCSHIFMATNTMHRVRDQIKASISIPFVDIFETVAEEILSRKYNKMGILGTFPVMNDDFYRKIFESFDIEVIAPDEADKKEIDRILFDELTKSVFTPSSKQKFIRIMEWLSNQGCQGVILACTEIKLLVNQQDIPRVPLFDTTTLHCDKAVAIMTNQV